MGLATAGYGQQPAHAPLRVFLNEVLPGTLSAPQFCTLVFDDHSFHSEKADIKNGRDLDRKIYEGQLSDTDWNALVAIIDSQDFRDLKVPGTVPPPVLTDTHPYTISVARGNRFQNMEFMTSKALKPYEPQIKPLLQWWKAFRGHGRDSTAPPDPRCVLDSSHAVFAQ
jgi:hypothetical protein